MTALRTVMKFSRSRISPKRSRRKSSKSSSRSRTVTKTTESIAGIVNSYQNRDIRYALNIEKFYIRVSSLINVKRATAFCAREHYLHQILGIPYDTSTQSAGMSLLYVLGHAIHDYVCQRALTSPIAPHVWARWSCSCGKSEYTGFRSLANACKHCKTPIANYNEIHLFNERFNIAGHPDLLLKIDGVIHLHEIKSIDRVDSPFDTLKRPLGDHVLQALLYYWLLRRAGHKVSKTIRYVYVDRSIKNLFGGEVVKEFHVPVTNLERIQPFLKQAMVLKKSFEAKKHPKKICDKSNCSRAKICRVSVPCFEL